MAAGDVTLYANANDFTVVFLVAEARNALQTESENFSLQLKNCQLKRI